MGTGLLLALNFVLSLILLSVFFYFLLRSYSDFKSWRGGAPFVGIPLTVAREALKSARVGPQDVLFDLGCGDGRVLRLALDEFRVKEAVGYEIALWPYLKGRLKAQGSRFNGTLQRPKITIRRNNLFQANLRGASVVFLFLTSKLLEKLKLKLMSELPDNARIIVVTWSFEHPFGQPFKQKTISWQPKNFEVYVFKKSGL